MLAYLGDAAVMIPAAVAIAGWLVLSGTWRMSLLWLLLFVLGCVTVALSKMAFMGWGTQIDAIAFKALSGHAMLTAAVVPAGAYLLAGRGRRIRIAATGMGILAGIGMGVYLVAFGHHTVSETIGGWLVGSAVSMAFIARHATSATAPQLRIAPLACVLIFLLIWLAKPGMMKLWVEEAALHLSGRSTPHDWND